MQAHTQSTADADLARQTAVADARDVYFTSLAAAQGTRDRELAGAQVTQAQIDALAAAKSLVAGTYDPARPVYPVTPEQYPYALDIIFAEDYLPRQWRAPGGYDPIAEMNATSLPSQRVDDYYDESWYMSRSPNSLRDGLIRQSESWADNFGENYFYEFQDNNSDGGSSFVPPSTPRVALTTAELLRRDVDKTDFDEVFLDDDRPHHTFPLLESDEGGPRAVVADSAVEKPDEEVAATGDEAAS